jgi:hypothetical protein
LIYGILFVSEVLGKIKPGVARRDAEKVSGGDIWGRGRGLSADVSE